MNSSSLTIDKFSIVRDDDGIPIAGSVSLNVDGKTATFTAASDLSFFPDIQLPSGKRYAKSVFEPYAEVLSETRLQITDYILLRSPQYQEKVSRRRLHRKLKDKST